MDEHLAQLQQTKTKNIFSKVWDLIKQHKVKSVVGLILITIIVLGVARGSEEPEEAQAVLKAVEVITISELISDGGDIPLVGTLSANDQIDLHPQIGGQVTAVHVSLNQYVGAGRVLVETSHRDMDASVAQASASLQSAQASYAKLKNGARPEDVIISQQNLEAARHQLEDIRNGGRPEEVAQAQNAVDWAFKSLDDANTNYVNTERQNLNTNNAQLENAMQAILGAQIAEDQILEQDLANVFDANDNDKLIPIIIDTALMNQANNARADVEFKLEKWEIASSLVNSTDKASVVEALDRAQTELNIFLSFLSVTGNALQEAHPTIAYPNASIASAKSAVNIARVAVKGHLDGVITFRQTINNQDVFDDKALEAARTQIDSAKTSLDNAREQLQIIQSGATPEQIAIQETRVTQAEQQLLIVQNGARPEDLRMAEASIAQARASLAMASANRAKAIITAPIAGTVTYLPVEVGDVISSATIAVSIANKSGLEVETFVSEKERAFIEIGNEVLINDEVKGVVREIAPALSPVNKKIEVNITVTGKNTNFTLGETVRLLIKKIAPEQAIIKVPLSTVKIKSTGAEVYKVNDNNQLEVVSVEVGEVTGNSIEILSQLDENTRLVKDARGIKEGEYVVVK